MNLLAFIAKILVSIAIAGFVASFLASFGLMLYAMLVSLWVEGTGVGEGYIGAFLIAPLIFLVSFIWISIAVYKQLFTNPTKKVGSNVPPSSNSDEPHN